MRFMMIVKHAEKQGPPPKQLMDAIAKLAEEAVEERHHARQRRARADRAGRPRPAFRRPTDRDRRAFHRSQGSGRRLCASLS